MSTKCEHNVPRMEYHIKQYWPLSLLIFFVGWAQLLAAEPDKVNFQRDIRPLLSDRCFHCHGPDEKARQADLRLDQWHSAQSAIKSDSTVGDSPLLQRILSTDPDQIMPPPEVNSHSRRARRSCCEPGFSKVQNGNNTGLTNHPNAGRFRRFQI